MMLYMLTAGRRWYRSKDEILASEPLLVILMVKRTL